MERDKPNKYDKDYVEVDERSVTTTTNAEGKILEAAEHVFAKYGFRGATTAMIAAKAGVTKPNIYYYFRNKEALYRKLLRSILAIWADSLRVIEADKPAEDCLRLYLARKMEFSRSKPQLSRIFATEIISGAPYIRDQISRATRPLLQEKAAVIERWIKEGKITPSVDPIFLIFLMWASTQAYADFAAQMQILLGKRQLERTDFEGALDTITAVVIGGVLPKKSARPKAVRGRSKKMKADL
ncbi:TetR/AcrR family transcriptional regulator [Hyphomicrobium sp. CS1GBMeth3]|uniref:TetR/AcrR family transcriptional regulator n=1 Tax=Hyphomicrobium sp. CS1GBMeth3 TaxID=1892845 RepID=UPI00092FDB54|nr:TetR/AcrR family transcriptional regulator [Hyphomicrobium sp. CS1GBMeth3]